MSHRPFSGVITAIVTPFKKNGDLDLDAFERIINLQIQAGIYGIVVLGTTGENPTLSESESELLVKTALKYRSSNFHIYVGSGTNDLRQTVEKSVKYSKVTVGNNKPDGLMVVTPYYNKPNQNHLIQYYREVLNSVSETPVCLYNVPGRTGICITPKTLVKIASENKNLVAIKEASGNLNLISEMRIALNESGHSGLAILSGDDPSFAPALLCGASGVISVTTNFIPKEMLNILHDFQKGNVENVSKTHLKIFCINSGIFCVPNPVGIKWMMSEMRICENVLRSPLYAADEEEAIPLKLILKELQRVKVI